MSNGETVRQYDARISGVDAYTVECPLCDAKVDQVCALDAERKTATSPHGVRIELARSKAAE